MGPLAATPLQDDVDYGTSFNAIEINRYHLSNPRSYSVQSLARIMG